MPDAVHILGMRVDTLSEAETVARIVGDQHGGVVVTPNLQHLREHRRDAGVREFFDAAEVVVPDGMPLLWAARLQRTALPDRVAGSDLIWSLSAAAAEEGCSIYLLGGDPDAAERAATVLTRHDPALVVAGTLCPSWGFERDPAEFEEVIATVAASGADIVYVGLPLARQMVVAAALRERLPRAWLVGLGVSFSFVAGEIRRAPAWMQRHGLEWLYRLYEEPRRLARRYLLEGLPFLAYLLWRALGARLRPELSQRS